MLHNVKNISHVKSKTVPVWVTATYIVATLQSSLHVLVHVVMIKSHEEGVDDDTQGDEQFNKGVKHEKGHNFLELDPQPATIPHAEDVNTPET